ncbi:MAG: hypothetical protein DRI61_09830 [Chloroflexi bacterium]|nr:MAG: hypothetical protein DRI61_09830 [Chloroflexota bacterium]
MKKEKIEERIKVIKEHLMEPADVPSESIYVLDAAKKRPIILKPNCHVIYFDSLKEFCRFAEGKEVFIERNTAFIRCICITSCIAGIYEEYL